MPDKEIERQITIMVITRNSLLLVINIFFFFFIKEVEEDCFQQIISGPSAIHIARVCNLCFYDENNNKLTSKALPKKDTLLPLFFYLSQ